MTESTPIPILDQLQEIIDQMKCGDHTESDMATLITRDRESGILTLRSFSEGGNDSSHVLLDLIAKGLGYARVN